MRGKNRCVLLRSADAAIEKRVGKREIDKIRGTKDKQCVEAKQMIELTIGRKEGEGLRKTRRNDGIGTPNKEDLRFPFVLF